MKPFLLRQMKSDDFDGVARLSRTIYPDAVAWDGNQLSSHLELFPEGQFIVEDTASGLVVGYAASLIVAWSYYDMTANWRDFTDNGLFTNHDQEGHRDLIPSSAFGRRFSIVENKCPRVSG
jgi:hypothetical protein